jgi:class 3 adenylate cyclase
VRLDASLRPERKVITALFCDVVGSTALGERMDPEDVDRLLRDYQRICRARIESHGGAVEKFIGDAVVGVFGVPTAHEDDAERAVRAALRIIDDVSASALGIEVRIGVNTGEALVRLDVDPRSGEGFATGDTMNTAARLEAAAPVMGVAVGAATYAASEGAIVYEAEVEPGTVGVCHCFDCQRLTGSPFRANIRAEAAGFCILKGQPRHYVKTGDSGSKRIHAFCEVCASPIYSCAIENLQSYKKIFERFQNSV